MIPTAQNIVERLRAHQAELEAMGVRHLALFGSFATEQQHERSDIDIGVAFDRAIKAQPMKYFGMRQRLHDRLNDILEADVDLSDEDLQKPAVRETYKADRLYAF